MKGNIADRTRRRLLAAGITTLAAPYVGAQSPARRPLRMLVDHVGEHEYVRDQWAREGFVEGKNLRIDALDIPAIPPRLLEDRMAEVVASNPDLIFMAFGPATVLLQRLTRKIPIVFHNCHSDLVKAGLIQSAARPGGNLTGTYHDYQPLILKRWSLYKEVLPSLKRAAWLTKASEVEPPPWKDRDAAMAYARNFLWQERETNAIAQRHFGIRIGEIVLPDDATEEQAIAAVRREKPEALRLNVDFADDGPFERFLVSERILSDLLVRAGSSPEEAFDRAVDMVPRILRGESPATIPVIQGTQYFVSLDLKMAKAMGIAIPDSVRIQARRINN